MKLKLDAINKVILFGGGPLLVATVKYLQATDYTVLVYTAPRHAREVLDADGVTLEQALNQLDCDWRVSEDINNDTTIRDEISSASLGIGMGEAWSFDADIIDLFAGKLLDFMGIPLPRYRGGAHYTWMIMRNERDCACNLQVINTEMVQGEFDSGELVKTKRYQFPDSARIPLDFFDYAVQQEVAFIEEFIQEVQAGKTFDLTSPDEEASLFFPRLNTLKQGWIDWRWSGEEIERFICAFDDPYVGASTYLSGKRVHLKKATLATDEKAFHSFQSGLITRTTPLQGVVIATSSGHLAVTVWDEEGNDISSQCAQGGRFVTPNHELEQAISFQPVYGV